MKTRVCYQSNLDTYFKTNIIPLSSSFSSTVVTFNSDWQIDTSSLMGRAQVIDWLTGATSPRKLWKHFLSFFLYRSPNLNECKSGTNARPFSGQRDAVFLSLFLCCIDEIHDCVLREDGSWNNLFLEDEKFLIAFREISVCFIKGKWHLKQLDDCVIPRGWCTNKINEEKMSIDDGSILEKYRKLHNI